MLESKQFHIVSLRPTHALSTALLPAISVQVTIMQQNGAGMSSYSSAVMDSTDGLVTATFENEHLIAVVNVFACWCG
jgi:hypothetical protein